VPAKIWQRPFFVRKRGRFTCRADRDDAVNSAGDLRFDQFFKRGQIDISVSEWRDQRSKSAAKHVF